MVEPIECHQMRQRRLLTWQWPSASSAAVNSRNVTRPRHADESPQKKLQRLALFCWLAKTCAQWRCMRWANCRSNRVFLHPPGRLIRRLDWAELTWRKQIEPDLRAQVVCDMRIKLNGA
jgi:hypothetical protein